MKEEGSVYCRDKKKKLSCEERGGGGGRRCGIDEGNNKSLGTKDMPSKFGPEAKAKYFSSEKKLNENDSEEGFFPVIRLIFFTIDKI